MGLHLIALTLNWELFVVILEVAFGLGMVIFVHELGHFAVAKWCGVQVDKFYLGFDVYGLKLARFKWGETEYGIGIVPLGGYVKMLGQDDNPANAAQERERSLLHPGVGAEAQMSDFKHPEEALNPRSYMAKTVPQRMAIISAGVIMNVIFAFVMATVAYTIGVRDIACGVSAVLTGESAWKANLQPGDRFLQIDDLSQDQLRFRDLMSAVMLGDLETGVRFKVKRDGVEEPFWVTVKPDPDKNRLRPTIGVVQPRTTQLSDEKPVIAGTPAAKAGEFKPGDTIVAVNGEPLASYATLIRELTKHQDEPLKFTIERKAKAAESSETPQRVEIEVQPRPMRTLGLVMQMGEITAVQDDSPAKAADIQPGDYIVSIDGQAASDPLRLPDELRRRAGQTITVSLLREGPSGERATLEKQITLREQKYPEEPEAFGSPIAVPALGLTYKVLNVVHEIQPDSPAAAVALKEKGRPAAKDKFSPGDEIVKAEFIFPASKDTSDAPDAIAPHKPEPIEFSEKQANWPYVMNQLQWVPDGSQIKLTLKDGRTATFMPVVDPGWFYIDRGFVNAGEMTTTKARSLNEAAALGARETKDGVLQVYSFLRRIGWQISPKGLGGPVAIAEMAGHAAYQGAAELLIFLTMLSANLAVINFLPIPLLDGGHMVFLALEGLMRKPVSERVVVAFHYVGFVFIISLMAFVLGLDFGLIPRH